jgi:hypothetical protein
MQPLLLRSLDEEHARCLSDRRSHLRGIRPQLQRQGEDAIPWVRLTVPLDRRDDNCEGGGNGTTHHASCAYVIVLAGEFLQLTSNGRVPVCIHRVVVPPKLPAVVVTGPEKGDCGYGGCGGGGGGNDVLKYKPRVSSPMFLHLRRGQG